MRKVKLERNTKETQISLELNLDGNGENNINTGVGFLNHMLQLFSVHSGYDLTLSCKGDIEVDYHHSVEDIAITLGQAFKQALGDKRGIARFSDRVIPMDESAVQIAIDISGRPYLNFDKVYKGKVGDFDLELVNEFLQAFTVNAGINLYVSVLKEGNFHHIVEAIFKGIAKCLKDATAIVSDKIPSSKGVL